MTDHGLEIGAVIDLYIHRGSSTGGREIDGSVWANVGEEVVFVPRCLPLGITSSATRLTRPRSKVSCATYHIPDTLRGDRQRAGEQATND